MVKSQKEQSKVLQPDMLGGCTLRERRMLGNLGILCDIGRRADEEERLPTVLLGEKKAFLYNTQ